MHLQHGLQLPDFLNAESSLPFILQLRPICEIIFDMLLTGYIAGLTAYYNKCEENEDENKARSLRPAEQALAVFREAEAHREAGEFDLADATADRALLALQERYDEFSASYQSFLTLPPQFRSSADFLQISRHHVGLGPQIIIASKRFLLPAFHLFPSIS